MRIYLDVCCLGRVFEEDEQPRIRAERAAVESILESEIQIVTSDAVAYEIARDPDEERRDAKTILDDEIRDETVKLTDSIKARAKQLGALGFGGLDALHIACAESARCDWLLTTDDRMLKRAIRLSGSINVAVENPAAWVLRFPKQ